MTPEASRYVGSELDLFAGAVNWKAYWAALVRPFLGERVLEVGAGIGSNTILLCDRPQRQWLCLEPDHLLAERLVQRTAAAPRTSSCRVEVGTLERLDPARRFDSILYIDVLEHIDDDAGEVRRAFEFLRPGGHLIVLAPAYQRLWSEFDRAIGHRRRYSRQGLLACTPPGLTVVRAICLDSVGLLASLANHALLKQSMPTPRQIRSWDRLMVPASRVVDRLVGYRFGKSVLVVWSRTA